MDDNANIQVFSKEWFTKHQKPLLRFANSWVGRRILAINKETSGVGKRSITRIDPNSITWLEDKERGIYSTEFRLNDRYARRLYLAFKPLWKFIHNWDIEFANNFNPDLNLGFDTLTAYPDPMPTATSATNPSTAANDSAVGSIAWTDPTNALTSDNTRATLLCSGTTVSNYLKVTNFGFSVTGTITGIQVTVERRREATGTTGNVRDNILKLVKGGTVVGDNKAATGSNWGTTEGSINYGGTFDMWGETWTSSDINASDFGAVLAVAGTAGSDRTAAVDNMRIVVYTTASTNFAADGLFTNSFSGTGATFSTLTSGSATAVSESTTESGVLLGTNSGTVADPNFNSITRKYMFFDTSALGASATISAAEIGLRGTNELTGHGSPELDIVECTATADYNLTVSNFNNFASTPFVSVTIAGWNTTAYNNLSLDSNGIASIDKTGVSKFGARLNWDVDGAFGGTWGGTNVSSGFIWRDADTAATTSDPKLTVTYTAASPTDTQVDVNAEITGSDTSTLDLNAEVTGAELANTDINSEITGFADTSTDVNAEVSGSDTASVDINSEISGSVDVHNDINAETTGYDSQNNDINAEVSGYLTAEVDVNSEISGNDVSSLDIDSEIAGSDVSSLDINSEITGSEDESLDIDIETTGYDVSTLDINSEITGNDTAVLDIDAELTGASAEGTDIDYDIDVEIIGSDDANTDLNAEVFGSDESIYDVNSELIGSNVANYDINTEIIGSDTASHDINTEISGNDVASIDLNGEITGIESNEYDINAEIAGFSSLTLDLDVELSGGIIESYDIDAELIGNESLYSDIAAQITGTVTDRQPFIYEICDYLGDALSSRFVFGGNLTVGELPLKEAGVYAVAMPSDEPDRYVPIREYVIEFRAVNTLSIDTDSISESCLSDLRAIYDLLHQKNHYNTETYEVYYSSASRQPVDEGRDSDGRKVFNLTVVFIVRSLIS